MTLDNIKRPENRDFIGGLFMAIREDEPYRCLQVKVTYEFASSPNVGLFVRPKFVVLDNIADKLTRVLEIGDGVLQPSISSESTFTSRLLQRLGHPKEEPHNLDLVHHVNQNYFMKGSNARRFMENRGYSFDSF